MPAKKLVIDTNVLIDAMVRGKDVRNRSSIELLRRIDRGEYLGILPTPVLVEVYYVVIDMTHDPERARKVLTNLLGSPNMQTQSIEREHALQAAEFFREMNYFQLGHGNKLGRREEGLSMVDALILAVGRSIPGSIVCSNESRFSSVKGVVVKKPWEIVDVTVEEKVDGR
jgi:predicted nucleic acid-binding protein